MHKRQVTGLKVSTHANKSIIFVPTVNAAALRTYLQRHGITCFHPEVATKDSSSIELRPKTDAKAVQALLDRWGTAQVEEEAPRA